MGADASTVNVETDPGEGGGPPSRTLSEGERLAARYRALVEQIPAITYTQIEDPTSPTGFRDVYRSPQLERILGYRAKEWGSDPTLWLKSVHPEDRDRVLREDQEASESGSPFSSEYRAIAGDGRIVWFRDEALLVRDPVTGKQIWQGVMLDITQQKVIEQHHLETEAKYQSLVEQIPAIVYLGEFGEEGEWLYISPQIEQVLGYTPQEWLAHPHPMASFTHPDDLPAVRAEEERAQREGDAFRTDYRLQRRDGTWAWILDEARVVKDPDGRPIVMQGVMYDMTARKEAEQGLAAALEREREVTEQLRKIDGIKATLLRALSHDLKGPMTAVMGAAATLDRLGDELPDDERASLLRTMVERTKKMDQVLSDLLDMERLEQGIVEPKRLLVDIGGLVAALTEDEHLTGGRPVTVVAEPLTIRVDAGKVERMVENLLTNAVRHTPAGSRIWVRVQEVEGGALIAIDDEGPGVPDEVKEAIFQPFTKAPGTETPGTGIGLSIVARFAEMHGGRAWVQDRAGGGASFCIFLPD